MRYWYLKWCKCCPLVALCVRSSYKHFFIIKFFICTLTTIIIDLINFICGHLNLISSKFLRIRRFLWCERWKKSLNAIDWVWKNPSSKPASVISISPATSFRALKILAIVLRKELYIWPILSFSIEKPLNNCDTNLLCYVFKRIYTVWSLLHPGNPLKLEIFVRWELNEIV